MEDTGYQCTGTVKLYYMEDTGYQYRNSKTVLYGGYWISVQELCNCIIWGIVDISTGTLKLNYIGDSGYQYRNSKTTSESGY